MIHFKSAWTVVSQLNGPNSVGTRHLWQNRTKNTHFLRCDIVYIRHKFIYMFSVQNTRERVRFAIFLLFLRTTQIVMYIFCTFFSGQICCTIRKMGVDADHSVCYRLLLMALDARLFLTSNSVSAIHIRTLFFASTKHSESKCIETQQKRKKWQM